MAKEATLATLIQEQFLVTIKIEDFGHETIYISTFFYLE